MFDLRRREESPVRVCNQLLEGEGTGVRVGAETWAGAGAGARSGVETWVETWAETREGSWAGVGVIPGMGVITQI